MDNLTRSNLPAGHLIGAPAPDRTGIVHLGLGNFHRAHAAVNTARAMAAAGGDWGIVGVANRSHRIVDPLAGQDNLYSILQLSPRGTEVGVVDVHRRLLVSAEQGPEVMAAIADPAHRIITLTISEKGYHKASDGTLTVTDPDIAADLATPEEARTPLGQLAFGLLRRYRESQAPVSVLSCDNMVSAGSNAQAMVTRLLDAAGAPGAVFDWLASSVTFPNDMVDRIVPGTTEETRTRVADILGRRDAVPVPAEEFTMWVIEDHFAAGRPAWEHAGVIFSDEVEKYELVKLRLLNGSHSLISYLGVLDGRPTIPASRGQEFVAACVDAAIRDEYLPSIPLPGGFDPEAYIAQLFDRWSNTALGDSAMRVASDGSSKLLQRIVDPALRMLDLGQTPHQMALTVAGWICCVCPPAGFVPNALVDQIDEPARDRLAEATRTATTVEQHVAAIMTGGFFPAELASRQAFTDRVAELTGIIVRSGVRAAAREALSAAGH